MRLIDIKVGHRVDVVNAELPQAPLLFDLQQLLNGRRVPPVNAVGLDFESFHKVVVLINHLLPLRERAEVINVVQYQRIPGHGGGQFGPIGYGKRPNLSADFQRLLG